jgi:hypothetical protein
MVGFKHAQFYILGDLVEQVLQQVFPNDKVNECRKEISSFTQE